MLGATIHDVAQVVGAAYPLSETAGNAAADTGGSVLNQIATSGHLLGVISKDGAAPTGGFSVALSSSNPAVAQVAQTVSVPAGSRPVYWNSRRSHGSPVT